MYNTLKNFKQIAILNSEELTPKLVESYKETQDGTILAKVFVKYFAHFKNVADRYFGLTDEDRASYIVEELHGAMMNYDSNKGSIGTLASRYIANRLRCETEAINADKRKSTLESDSFEAKIEEGARGIEGAREDEIVFESVDLIDSLDLTPNEKEFCKIFLLDRTQELANPENDTTVGSKLKVMNTEIATLLNISPTAVKNIKDSLKKKLNPFTLCYGL